MAAFFVDVDVAMNLAALLASRRHDVEHARDLGLGRANDATILITAARRRRILLTHNRADFLLLHRAWLIWPAAWGTMPRPHHAGIVTLPQEDEALHGQLIQTIEARLAGRPSMINELHAWRGGRWEQH